MLDKLRNFDPRGGFQLEDAMVLAASARQVAAEYDALKVAKPSWLDDKIEELRRFIADTQRDARKKALAELKARRTTYLSASERRDLIDKQIAELEALAQ